MQQIDRPMANPVVVLREEFDDCALLFNPDTAEAIGLNPSGVFVWKQMDGSRSLAEIVETMREQFESTPPDALDDVTSFVQTLYEKGFVGSAIDA